MANILKGKKIVLGITGSIAAYKACYIIRGLIKRGAEVQVVITPAGKEFITPITLSALTSKPVISEFFAQRDGICPQTEVHMAVPGAIALGKELTDNRFAGQGRELSLIHI